MPADAKELDLAPRMRWVADLRIKASSFPTGCGMLKNQRVLLDRRHGSEQVSSSAGAQQAARARATRTTATSSACGRFQEFLPEPLHPPDSTTGERRPVDPRAELRPGDDRGGDRALAQDGSSRARPAALPRLLHRGRVRGSRPPGYRGPAAADCEFVEDYDFDPAMLGCARPPPQLEKAREPARPRPRSAVAERRMQSHVETAFEPPEPFAHQRLPDKDGRRRPGRLRGARRRPAGQARLRGQLARRTNGNVTMHGRAAASSSTPPLRRARQRRPATRAASDPPPSRATSPVR